MSTPQYVANGQSRSGTAIANSHGEALPPSRSLQETTKGSPPSFESILFPHPGDDPRGSDQEPECFHDLHLDQVIESVVRGREDYDLKPFFQLPLRSLPIIIWRQEIVRDLERPPLAQGIKAFSEGMRLVQSRCRGVGKLYYEHQKEAWILEAAEAYCAAVQTLLKNLTRCPPLSRGLRAFHHYLEGYVTSDRFKTLNEEAAQLRIDLSQIRYSTLIRGLKVTVLPYEPSPDYSVVIENVFARFKQGVQKDYRLKFPDASGMNHVEALILERVAWLNPEVFEALGQFCIRRRDFIEPLIATFDREVQFYLAYLDHIQNLQANGLEFCHPAISETSKEIFSRDGFDLALAGKLADEKREVVTNEFDLQGAERIFVVTGPNQGGKTTFARTFGQLHYFARLGLPVPGTSARIFLCDRIFVHFEREEDIATLRGKLEDDLYRVHHILQNATPDSVIVINEIFSSTTLRDAVDLGTRVLKQISSLDCLATCVTFLDELTTLNDKVVSIVAEVVPGDATLRTHKLKRKPADGLAYALAIAKKYRLTYPQLMKRLKR